MLIRNKRFKGDNKIGTKKTKEIKKEQKETGRDEKDGKDLMNEKKSIHDELCRLQFAVDALIEKDKELMQTVSSLPKLEAEIDVKGRELNQVIELIKQLQSSQEERNKILTTMQIAVSEIKTRIEGLATRQNDIVKAMNSHTKFLQDFVFESRKDSKIRQKAELEMKAEMQKAIIAWITKILIGIGVVGTAIIGIIKAIKW